MLSGIEPMALLGMALAIVGIGGINLSGRLTERFVLKVRAVPKDAPREQVLRVLETSLRGPAQTLVRVPKWYSLVNLMGWTLLVFGIFFIWAELGWWVLAALGISFILIFLTP